MGKATGFLQYEREDNPAIEPENRITNFKEFHKKMELEERRIQGARCMNCGIPFCQSAITLNNMVSGCPLHNLIPEWNDEVYNGNWEHALARLKKTNNFPEFTGRVCPGLCEAACTCGLYDDPVTVKENELAIIETAYAMGTVKPNPPILRTNKKIAIIGSGPSGLACADQLNLRGHNVTVFEKEDRVGGLLMYGIPNMKLEKWVIDRRIKLMRDEGVEFITRFDGSKPSSVRTLMKNFDAIVLCCGAAKPRPLEVKGCQSNGVYFAVDFLKGVTKSLLKSNLKDDKYISAKDKNVIIVGGGDTGNDCLGTCIRLGCKSVRQLEIMGKAPIVPADDNQWPQWPKVCKIDYGQEEAIAIFGRDPRTYKTTIKEIVSDDSGDVKAAKLVNLETGAEEMAAADMILIAAGFLGADPKVAKAFNVKLNKRTNVMTFDGSYMTSKSGIFAAGDIRRGQSLVVWAINEGRQAAREVDNYLMGYSNMIE